MAILTHWRCALVGSLILVLAGPAFASVEVNYIGQSGLQAHAEYDLVSATQLSIILTNNSVAPFGGSGVNGDANMVLSSINFELGGPSIVGGSVTLNGASSVVERSGTAWVTDGGYAGNLNKEYGYSNTGVGNKAASSSHIVGLTTAQIDTLLDGAVTSHSNGGMHVTNFLGTVGGVDGGLDFGLVASGSTGFGNNNFVLSSVKILLNLSGAGLTDLSFLDKGSYVEFGSDYSYVGGLPEHKDDVRTAPELASVATWLGLMAACSVIAMKRNRKFAAVRVLAAR
jgi:hypothetical protein